MTQDEIFEMSRRAKLNYLPINETENNKKKLIDFAKLVAQHEREACAKVCEEQMQGKSIWVEGARACSLAIRARGQA